MRRSAMPRPWLCTLCKLDDRTALGDRPTALDERLAQFYPFPPPCRSPPPSLPTLSGNNHESHINRPFVGESPAVELHLSSQDPGRQRSATSHTLGEQRFCHEIGRTGFPSIEHRRSNV